MKTSEIFDLAIKLGMKNDLRGETRVKKNLGRVKACFDKLSSDKKEEFDQDKLNNPYPDSQIVFENEKSVKRILTGIDIGVSELLLAKQLGGFDLVIAHHPLAKGLANLSEVMALQAEVLADYGVPINVAEGCLKMRIGEVSRGVSPINHYREADAARLLDLNLMNAHTPADNMVASFLKKQLAKKKFEYVGEIMDELKKIPEYAEAMKRGAGPRLFAGAEENYCGKIALTEITGGTSGSSQMYEKMAQAGIGTIIGMHMGEEHKKEAEKYHLNVIIAGHISSDSLGMNLLLDEIEKKGIEIVPCSGLIRVKRKK
jgi:putative NIF3 family GTP cyclohydrolase 1 type 2